MLCNASVVVGAVAVVKTKNSVVLVIDLVLCTLVLYTLVVDEAVLMSIEVDVAFTIGTVKLILH